MAYFLSNYTNKVDKKGRVSVPASFRAALLCEDNPAIMIYPSFTSDALECSKFSYLERIVESIDDLNPFANDRSAFATAVLSIAVELNFDKEGRIVIPAELLAERNITDQATFVGLGKVFRIMSPEAFKISLEESRILAMKQRETFRFKGQTNSEGGE